MKPKLQLAAMVRGKLEPLRRGTGCLSGPDIALEICVVGEDGKPRNYHSEFDHPETCPGGCVARVFRSDYGDALWTWYGPELSWAGIEQYRRAFAAVKHVAKRMDAFYARRGSAVDAAECFGRWLEACDVDTVLVRATGERSGWLNVGEWQSMTAGAFVGRVRQLCAPETKEGVAV